MPTLDATRALQSSERIWEQEILPALHEYIRIPNHSPLYDPEWKKKGYMNAAVDLARMAGLTPAGVLVEVIPYSFRPSPAGAERAPEEGAHRGVVEPQRGVERRAEVGGVADAAELQRLLERTYSSARKVHLVLDNLNTHFRSSFEQVLGRAPAAALELLQRM